MAIQEFPAVDSADEFGLLAVGGDVEVESLELAYRSGIFPWPIFEEGMLAWFAPETRAVLFFEKFHVSRSLLKKRRRGGYQIRIDTDFNSVIEACAASENRKGQSGTWITSQIIKGYQDFHKAGFCHSIECFQEESLIGGLYGVAIGGMFAGESMFYREPDASKLALWYLVEYLQNKGVAWIDCQQMTPLLEQFGAVEVGRKEYMDLLDKALVLEVELF